MQRISIFFPVLSMVLFLICCSPPNPSSAQTPEKTKPMIRYTSGIRSILHDKQGRYWIGSHNEGLCMYNGKDYRYFTTRDGLAGNQIRSLFEDPTGTIWAETEKGPCQFNGIGFSSPKIPMEFSSPANVDPQHYLHWFNAGGREGAYGFDGKNWLALRLSDQNAGLPGPFEGLSGFTREPGGAVWFAIYSTALRWDGSSFSFLNDSVLGISGEHTYLHIRSILFDSKGNLWLGNNGMGVVLWREGKASFFSKDMGLWRPGGPLGAQTSPSGTLEHVFAITEDPNGHIWFGDRDTGAWRFDGKDMKHFTVDASLPSQHIWQIYVDTNGDLLFAMGNGGVYRLAGEDFERIF